MHEKEAAPPADQRRTPPPPHRKLTSDDSSYVITHGLQAHFWQDIYHRALLLRWPAFFGLAALLFVLLNIGFALLYRCGTHAIANQAPPGLLGAFFFSVETLATVGYGDMHPDTIYGHVIATIEIFIGMSCVALTTGMIFARFSLPHARIVFSKYAIVRPIDGKPTLMVRAANVRLNVISEATAHLSVMRSETTPEGFAIRRVHDLKLIRHRHPTFILGWSLMHVIDEHSPLFDQTVESLLAARTRLLLAIEGTDDSTMQHMQARHTWSPNQICWDHEFVDVLYEEDGTTHVDYSVFDDVRPL
jgi:inward rectifier potassium channel